ncbi:MAG TPA: hypothetical protein VKK79_02660, partial [Candidatus Lokiarchaeia archaeon]|nr:hypothetical protein [Candidatus Lokiarchaeia archaeon]
MVSGNTPWWNKFLADVAAKTRCRKAAPAKLSYALSNAVARPVIYAAFGIHGNILFPDAGYCEFDDPDRAWEHLMRWATVSGKWRDPPVVGDGGFPVGFEVGIVSLEEMAKTRPVWELLKQNNVEFINPLYSQPYLRHVGEESNVRQFEEGLASLHAHDLAVEVFASSEHALHPQIPQLLRGFGIDRAYATVRLAGGGPTAYDPKVSWVGVDGTKITAIASQSGLPNGHIWHGAFFEEMPGLIFAAVGRPDLKQVVYANIEDFANPMPGSEDVIAHLAECAKNKIYFRGFKDIATDDGTIPISREVRWSLDDFPIRRMLSELITATRNCEDLLVSVEAADALLASFGKRTHEKELHDAWKKLLIAENHDAFVVPFTTPGMYSAQQGIAINNQWDATETIEARCLRAIQEAEKIARTVLQDYTQGRGGEQRQALLNILWGREEVVNKTTYALPALGYAAEGTPYEPRHSFEVRGNSIVIDDTSVVLNREIQSSQQGDILEVQGEKWTARVDDRGARVEIL